MNIHLSLRDFLKKICTHGQSSLVYMVHFVCEVTRKLRSFKNSMDTEGLQRGIKARFPRVAVQKHHRIYPFTVLEAPSPRSRCWQGHTPFEIWRGILPGLFQLPGAPGVPWLVSAELQAVALSLHGCLPSHSVFSPLRTTSHWTGAHPDDLILT